MPLLSAATRAGLRRVLSRLGLGLLLLHLVPLAQCGCSLSRAGRYEVRGVPAPPFDAVIIPGCPSAADGALSTCQMRRAAWGALLYQRGYARHFITSGAAVHSPYVEAEALAAALHALGVPEARIYLEPQALHTDENMYNAMRLARRLHWRRLAVASDRGHALGGCEMLASWSQPCHVLSIDNDDLRPFLSAQRQRLLGVRTARVSPFIPLAERERELHRRTGRARPPSALLYPFMGLMTLLGRPWIPRAPAEVPVIVFAAPP
jgi:hypothetical protein